ncbi:hemerythrin domain-containing protein [Caldimonas brevitalea]|uniref:Cation-binding protein n=1 Tax=Caldimonas brevitalea TaxID=413882 RepID=A0A0G3BJ34_9BURK|nr:hemerythrin domain-containing protein [Caldimonas brevitalea]AKJ28008.1 cation-binding protein [Caldimonas brevitalea]
MNPMLSKMSPSITKMIRLDHTHTLTTFHKYEADASPDKKRAIVNTVCLALEIHAQLEEEIFYPALREVASDNDVLAKSKPEHDEMRRLIEQLRSMEPTDANFDNVFMELMRDVTHHVADEETVLLPAAETLLKDRLNELGAAMTKRRLQLAAPHAGEMAANAARAMPTGALLMTAGGLLAGSYLLKRAFDLRRH